MAPRWVSLLLVVAAVAACSGDDDDDASSTPDAPETPAAGSPKVVVEDAAPPDVPECRADQVLLQELEEGLMLTSGEGPAVAAPGDRYVTLVARDGERCALSAWPSIRLTSSAGEPDPLVPEPGFSEGPPGGRLLVTGNQQVAAILGWNSSCAPADAVVKVESVLPSGDTLSADLRDPPGCDPSAENTARTWLYATDSDGPVGVVIEDVPEKAAPGGTFEFTVRVYNLTPDPVRLDPCPEYSVYYSEAGNETGPSASTGGGLDCSAAPDELPPGGQLRFAAELPIDAIPTGFGGGLIVDVTLGDDTTGWTVVGGPSIE